jgi:hypothetical protein
MGHLTHMPGHLYIRLGRWHDAVTTNQAALRADEAGVKRWDGFGTASITSRAQGSAFIA